MKPLVINVDSDGVVYQFSKAIREAAEEEFGVDLSDPSQTWELWKDIGISKSQFYKFFHEQIMAGVFTVGEPVPGAVEAVSYLVDQGHRVRIVTSKMFPNTTSNLLAKSDTLAWYHSQGLIDDIEFVFTGNGHAKQGYPADVVIDDKPTLEWKQDRPSTLNILFDQPWNQSVSNRELQDSNVVRAYGWNDVLRGIEGHVIVV